MFKSYFLLALFALSTVALVGCDSNDEEDAVLGLWFADEIDGEEVEVYLDIDNDEIVQYTFFDFEDVPEVESCYFIARLDVVSRDDDEWVIEDTEGEEVEATIRRDGDDLLITSEGDTIRFERSNVNTSTLTPECENGEFRQQRLTR